MERTKEEVVKDIQDVLQKFVAPVVDSTWWCCELCRL